MAMSYRRVSVLLPVPPYNQNSCNHVKISCKKKYVKNLELINKDLKKKKWLQAFEASRFRANVRCQSPLAHTPYEFNCA